MKSTEKILLFAVGFFFAACSEETTDNGGTPTDCSPIDGITMTVKDYEMDDATRTAIALSDSKLTFTWSQGDRIGVFGESKLQQVALDMTSGQNTKKASFKSDDYQLVQGKCYVAYYPMVTNTDQHADDISIDYSGQKQAANNDLAHLPKYDYIVSAPTKATETNTAAFTLNHIGAILRLKLTMPEADTWQNVTLSTTEEAFTTSATIDLFTRKLSNETKSSSVTLDLNNVKTTANSNVLTAWIMLSPIDLTGQTVSVSVRSSKKEFVASFTPTKEYVAGKAYSVSVAAEESLFLYGPFKVGENTYVSFTNGNLQYDIQNKRYQLAENQWTCIRADEGNVDYFTLDSDNKIVKTDNTDNPYIIDLFGWGTAWNPVYGRHSGWTKDLTFQDYLGPTDKVGIPGGKNNNIENGNFTSENDWGTAAGKDVPTLIGSRTLTKSEYIGLFQYQCWAFVKMSVEGVTIHGVAVFPYNMSTSTARRYVSGGTVQSTGQITSSNTIFFKEITESQMTVNNLNASGALFLPCGGSRFGTQWHDNGYTGNYWSSTGNSFYSRPYYIYEAYCGVYFSSGDSYKSLFTGIGEKRDGGYSVRLAKDVAK